MDEAVRGCGSPHEILPAPVDVRTGTGPGFALRPGLAVAAGPGAEVAASRLAALLAGTVGAPVPVRADGAVQVELVAGAFPPEGYTLDVTAASVRLRAAGGAGLAHGVQTLRQLLPATAESRSTVDSCWALPIMSIVDHPRFAYRGVMLDVARHFFDVADVTHLIDLAALYKLNHLHLHLSDDQGWRLAIDRWPRLATHGGAGEVGDGPGGWYTQDQYRHIVGYAAARHITVVPEFDLPGHTNAALAAYPELAADGAPPVRYSGTEVGFSALVADRELTYRFLDDVFGELVALTPGPYLHIGGDEALTMTRDDYSTIVTRAQEIVASHGHTAVGWHEVVNSKLAPGTVLQFWGTSAQAPDVVAAAAQGNRVILSPANRCYLDMKYDAASPLGLEWAGHISVADAYDWDPAAYVDGLDPAAVLGIESPLWTETVRSRADLEYLALPRLAATAELGWSPRATHDWAAFSRRLGAQAPRWAELGLSYHRAPGVPWR